MLPWISILILKPDPIMQCGVTTKVKLLNKKRSKTSLKLLFFLWKLGAEHQYNKCFGLSPEFHGKDHPCVFPFIYRGIVSDKFDLSLLQAWNFIFIFVKWNVELKLKFAILLFILKIITGLVLNNAHESLIMLVRI